MDRRTFADEFLLRTLLGLGLLSTGLAADLAAQHAKIERAAFEALQIQRLAIAERLEDASPELRRELAARFLEPHQNPFEVTAEGWLRVQGQDVDDDGLVRGGLVLFALPEVLDPRRFDSVHLTVHAPRIVPLQGEIEFEILRYRAGRSEVVATIGPYVREDILRFKATTTLPITREGERADLEFGVRAIIDGRPHRAHDWIPRTRAQVFQGFAERVQVLPTRLDGRAERLGFVGQWLAERSWLTPLERADLDALCQGLDRVWNGEPRWPGHEPLRDLRLAEALVAAAKKRQEPVKDDGASDSATGPSVPETGPALLGVALDATKARPAEVARMLYDAPGKADGESPVCLLVATGAPSFDSGRTTPTAMRGLAPEAVRAMLAPEAADFRPFGLAVVETPSGRRGSSELIARAVARLREEDPDLRIVIASDRDSGFAVSRAVVDDPDAFVGVALFSGGSFTLEEMQEIGDRPVLLAASQGHVTEGSYRWLAERSEQIEMLDSDGVLWFAQLRQVRSSLLAWLQQFRG